jgi:hypothetical protein
MIDKSVIAIEPAIFIGAQIYIKSEKMEYKKLK